MSEYDRRRYFTLPSLKDTKNYLATPSVLDNRINVADVIIEKIYSCPVERRDKILTLHEIIAAQRDVTILDPKFSTRPYEAEDAHVAIKSFSQKLFGLIPNPVRQLILKTLSTGKIDDPSMNRLVDLFQFMDKQPKMAVCGADYNLAAVDPNGKYGNTIVGKVVEEIYGAEIYDVEQCGTCVLGDAQKGVATRSCGAIFRARGVIGAPGKSP